MIYHIPESSRLISYYNLITKSQVTFELDRNIGYYNQAVLTKDNKIFIVGRNVYELNIVAQKLELKAPMIGYYRDYAAVVYEST